MQATKPRKIRFLLDCTAIANTSQSIYIICCHKIKCIFLLSYILFFVNPKLFKVCKKVLPNMLRKDSALFVLHHYHGTDSGYTNTSLGSIQGSDTGFISIDTYIPTTGRQWKRDTWAIWIKDHIDAFPFVFQKELNHIIAVTGTANTAVNAVRIRQPQQRMRFAERYKSFVVIDCFSKCGILQLIPANGIDTVAGIVAILAEAAVFLDFQPEHFLARMDKGNTLGSQINRRSQLIHAYSIPIDPGFAGR